MQLPDMSKVGGVPPQAIGGLSGVQGGSVSPGVGLAINPVNPAAATNMASRAKAKELALRDEYDQAKEIRANEEAERVRLQGYDESQAVRQWQRQNDVYDDEKAYERDGQRRRLNLAVTQQSLDSAISNHTHTKNSRKLELQTDLFTLKNDIANNQNLESYRSSVDTQISFIERQMATLEGRLLAGVMSNANTKYEADDEEAVKELDDIAKALGKGDYGDVLDSRDLEAQKKIANQILLSDSLVFGSMKLREDAEAEAATLSEQFNDLTKIRAGFISKGIDVDAAQELVRVYQEMMGVQPQTSLPSTAPSAPPAEISAPPTETSFLDTLTITQEASLKNFLVKAGKLEQGQDLTEVPGDVLQTAFAKTSGEAKVKSAEGKAEEATEAREDFETPTVFQIPGMLYDAAKETYEVLEGFDQKFPDLDIPVGSILTFSAIQQMATRDSTLRNYIKLGRVPFLDSKATAAAKRRVLSQVDPEGKSRKPNPIATPQQKPPGPNATDQQKRDYRKSVQQQPGPQATDPQARVEAAKQKKADWIKADQKLSSDYETFQKKHGYNPGPKPPAGGGTPEQRRQWRKKTAEHFQKEVENHRNTRFSRFKQRFKNNKKLYGRLSKVGAAGLIVAGVDFLGDLNNALQITPGAKEELAKFIKEEKAEHEDHQRLIQSQIQLNEAWLQISGGNPSPTDSATQIIAPDNNTPPAEAPPIPASIIQTPTASSVEQPMEYDVSQPAALFPNPALRPPNDGSYMNKGDANSTTATPVDTPGSPPPPPGEVVEKAFYDYMDFSNNPGSNLEGGDLRVDNVYNPDRGTYQFGYLIGDQFISGEVLPDGKIIEHTITRRNVNE